MKEVIFMPGVGAFFMNNILIIFIIVALILVSLFLIVCIAKLCNFKLGINVKWMARTGIFAALSVILYTVPFLKFKVPFFPPFLEIHLDEIPALIAGFAYGPFSGIMVIAVKTIIKLPMTTTMGVGELADLIYSIAFVVPAAIIYRYHRNIKGAIISLLVASVIQAAVASIVTAFIMLDFYVFMMPGLSMEAILAMCNKINPNITSLGWSFVLYVGLPFNLFKDAIVIVVTFVLYKRLHRLIDKI